MNVKDILRQVSIEKQDSAARYHCWVRTNRLAYAGWLSCHKEDVDAWVTACVRTSTVFESTHCAWKGFRGLPSGDWKWLRQEWQECIRERCTKDFMTYYAVPSGNPNAVDIKPDVAVFYQYLLDNPVDGVSVTPLADGFNLDWSETKDADVIVPLSQKQKLTATQIVALAAIALVVSICLAAMFS